MFEGKYILGLVATSGECLISVYLLMVWKDHFTFRPIILGSTFFPVVVLSVGKGNGSPWT